MEEKYDAVIVGAGFGGVYNLIRLRDLGLRCKLIEAGSDFGGVWHWNRYPGARVDSDVPVYEFSFPELWKDWNWTERYPGWKELQAYFTYVDGKLNLRKDCRFDSRVKEAHWDDQSHVWHVVSDGKNGTYRVVARHLILCTGFASKPYTPSLKGLETFRGIQVHTSRWPDEGIETSGKRVGVIGTGSSGIQVIQEIGQHAEHLTVFQRTPNLAVPLRQYGMTKVVQDHFKDMYEEIYQKLPTTVCGFAFNPTRRLAVQDSEQEREKTFRTLWDRGGFRFVSGNYQDIMVIKESNDAVYAFWREKVLERVTNPEKKELLAPATPPHPFGCKRASMEMNYFEVLNQDNVDIIDVNAGPIVEVTPKGVRTTEKEHELDVLVLATGFDTHTGAFIDMDLRGVNGKTIQDHWQDGVISYLGLTIDGFPNLFYVYGPQGPTALANGPTCVEIQGSWIVQTIDYLRQHGITKFAPSSHVALTYKKHINDMFEKTLFPLAKSWYNGANIPGKKREAYNYVGGIPNYRREIMEEMERGYPSFEKDELVKVPTSIS